MTKKRAHNTRLLHEKLATGFYRDESGRTRPITSKNIGAALAKGVVIKRVVDGEGRVIEKAPPQPKLKPQMLSIPDKEGTWVALITGSDRTYRFARIFLDEYDKGHYTRIYTLIEGVYEMNRYNVIKHRFERSFFAVEGESVRLVQKHEVEKMFPQAGR